MREYQTFIGQGPVALFDKYGKLFYGYNPPDLKPFYFNIRDGDYTVQGNIRRSDKTMVYQVNGLQKTAWMPDRFTIRFVNDGTKGSVILEDGEFCLDEKFRKQPIYMIDFVIGHEFGHYHWPTPATGIRDRYVESKCDKFSAGLMLYRGYNPSQVAMAAKFVLSEDEENDFRYGELIKYVNNVKYTLV